MKHGPVYGYYSEVEMSYYVCKDEDEVVAQEDFDTLNLQIQISRDRNYLGGCIGSVDNRKC